MHINITLAPNHNHDKHGQYVQIYPHGEERKYHYCSIFCIEDYGLSSRFFVVDPEWLTLISFWCLRLAVIIYNSLSTGGNATTFSPVPFLFLFSSPFRINVQYCSLHIIRFIMRSQSERTIKLIPGWNYRLALHVLRVLHFEQVHGSSRQCHGRWRF